MSKTNSKSGFTMVEIIAVLVIIGIMTAVAAPKFVSMAAEAKNKSLAAGISEAKASLSIAYAKAYLTNDGSAPNQGEILTAAGFTSGSAETFGDVDVTITQSAATDGAGTSMTISAAGVSGSKLEGGTLSGAEYNWTVPTQ